MSTPALQTPASGTVTMFSTTWCGYCRRLKSQMDREGIGYIEVNIEHDAQAAAQARLLNVQICAHELQLIMERHLLLIARGQRHPHGEADQPVAADPAQEGLPRRVAGLALGDADLVPFGGEAAQHAAFHRVQALYLPQHLELVHILDRLGRTAAGAHGVAFPAMASEFYALTDNERLRLTELVVAEGAADQREPARRLRGRPGPDVPVAPTRTDLVEAHGGTR